MADREFGNLRKIDPREIWENEATDFTPWLAKNINALGDALGLELETLGSEEPVGDFCLDILAKDVGRDRTVIIENQLTPTNHDHLGKLLTYASGHDADVVVWIAKDFREEHRQAIDWMNQITDEAKEFYGVVLEVQKIDDSRPAYNLKPVAFPNQWRKTNLSSVRGKTSERAEVYRRFFQALIDELREKHQFTGARSAQPRNFYNFSSNLVTGIGYGASFADHNRFRCEVYIDRPDAAINKSLFDSLLKDKAAIEKEFGESLEWERLDGRRASRIAVYRPRSAYPEEDEQEEIRAWAVERILKIKKVLGPGLKKLLK